jgi:hypothetical protein
MKQNGKHQKRALWIVVPVALLALLLSASLIYLESYYHADDDAIAAFSVERTVEERTLDGNMVFDPGNAKVGLIFYPGGKVEQEAYAPLMREISANGVLCVLCRMPFRLAVFDMHAADGVREAFPKIEQWYIGGHSLGGAVASIEAEAHPGVYAGMVLLASFSDKDLAKEALRVLSIYGSEDRVLNREAYEQAKSLLPDDVTETVIEGGCHAYFGMYGAQDGDGKPSITNEEQIRITAKAIIDWILGGNAACV